MRPVYCLPCTQKRKVPVVIPLYHYWSDALARPPFLSSGYGELLYGAMKSAEPDGLERLHQLREAIPSLPLPENAAEAYPRIRADLAIRGEVIGNNDLWIAAHALAAELTLVTNNVKRIPPRARTEDTKLGGMKYNHSPSNNHHTVCLLGQVPSN